MMTALLPAIRPGPNGIRQCESHLEIRLSKPSTYGRVQSGQDG
jgi:hypothetical protein